jgi:hypothetical protein
MLKSSFFLVSNGGFLTYVGIHPLGNQCPQLSDKSAVIEYRSNSNDKLDSCTQDVSFYYLNTSYLTTTKLNIAIPFLIPF